MGIIVNQLSRTAAIGMSRLIQAGRRPHPEVKILHVLRTHYCIPSILSTLAMRHLLDRCEAFSQFCTNSFIGRLPYHDLGLWVLFKWLSSGAGIDLIDRFCRLTLEQYANRRIKVVAFRHVMTLSMDFHSNKNSGSLMEAISQGQQLYGMIEYFILDVRVSEI